MGAINNEQRLVFHPDITRIGKSTNEPANMSKIIVLGVCLLHQHFRLAPVPNTRPILVSPAETKREVRLTRSQHFVEGPFEQALALEPIVKVTEACHSVLPRQVRLSF